jgi:hypothetical protein
MAELYPLVVPKTRTVNIGGQSYTKERLSQEIDAQSRADVQAMIRNITAADTAEQIRIGNPPQLLEVDNLSGKQLRAVQKKSVVLFGTLLAGAAMRMAEQELRANILKTTNVHTGRLSSITSAWEWRFIPRGGAARVIRSPGQLPSFQAGDMLTLTPVQVPYATLANRNVARSGQLQKKATKRRAAQNLGFLGMTARALRKRPEFRQFAVSVDFTKAHAVAGEVMSRKQGTGVLTIKARLRRGRGPVPGV